jgi:hypothetical protein
MKFNEYLQEEPWDQLPLKLKKQLVSDKKTDNHWIKISGLLKKQADFTHITGQIVPGIKIR